MKQTLSVKLKLHTTPEQFQQMRATTLAYRDALNFVSQYAFEHGKTSSNKTLHRGCYRQIRERYGLPSQMACSVRREVAATYKGLWTKLMKNIEHRKMGLTKKRFKGLDKSPTFVSPTLTYQHGYDYSFRQEKQVSLLTSTGRIHVPYTCYSQHLAWIGQGAECGAAKLWYDKPRKQFYLLVSIEIEKPDPHLENHQHVIGVDVGIRYLAVTSDAQGNPSFHPGHQTRHRANHCARVRKRLQRKGTRHAKRRLVTISRRERRLKQQANHEISKHIIQQHPHAIIGMEDLSGIREHTRRKKRRSKKNGTGTERVSRKQRRANGVYSKWSFAELQAMIAYKAALSGSMTILVDADYTSKSCPCCGHVADENRPQKGLLFHCVGCGYELHADLIGARNVMMRTLLIRQDWIRTGDLSVRPDGSDKEAKAARLSRYAELRWSSDPSSSPQRQLSH